MDGERGGRRAHTEQGEGMDSRSKGEERGKGADGNERKRQNGKEGIESRGGKQEGKPLAQWEMALGGPAAANRGAAGFCFGLSLFKGAGLQPSHPLSSLGQNPEAALLLDWLDTVLNKAPSPAYDGGC